LVIAIQVPKFLADDLPLFQAIVLDLFPGVEIPPNGYGDFLVALEEEIANAGKLIHTSNLKSSQPIDCFNKVCKRFRSLSIKSFKCLISSRFDLVRQLSDLQPPERVLAIVS
jgi:hypothetical protein